MQFPACFHKWGESYANSITKIPSYYLDNKIMYFIILCPLLIRVFKNIEIVPFKQALKSNFGEFGMVSQLLPVLNHESFPKAHLVVLKQSGRKISDKYNF